MTPKIVCLDGATLYPAASSQWSTLAALGDLTVYDRTAPADVVARCAGADIVLTNKVVLDAAAIAALPQLRYIGVLATGYNIVDVEAAHRHGVVVTNIPSYSTVSVAQHAIALLMAITSRVESYAATVADGHWTACADFSYRLFDWSELAGKVFGVVGFGNIGRATAAIAAALGMTVAVVTSKSADALPAGYVKMELDELFAKADVVSLHCPLTPDTRNMADARRIGLMKTSAILINTARGPLVDEQALAEALRQGRIFGAGCDVLCQEPPSASCPLIGAPNCYITPHIAWASAEARTRLLGIAETNIRAFLAGKPVNTVG